MAHDAFISYSHSADEDIAPALEKGMERLARPWYRIRALDVFRDQSDLALTPHLWETIRTTIDGVRFLVVLLSPESAASKWVNQEVAHWCDTRGTDQLLIVLTGGEVMWDDRSGDFSVESTAVPPSLRGRYRAEPLYEDLRWAHTAADLTLRNPRFRSAVARLAAPIHGIPPDDLEGEDVRLRRRARRLARAGVAGLAVLTVVATVASIVAVQQADRARSRATEAEARRAALAALDLPISRLDEALVSSLRSALRDVDNADRFRSAQTLIGRYPRLMELLPVEQVSSPSVVSRLAISADGTVAVDVLSIDGGAAVHTLLRPQVEQSGAVPLGSPVFVSYVGETNSLVTIDDASRAEVVGDGAARPLDGEVRALNAGADRAVVLREGTQVLVTLNKGEDVAVLGPSSEARPLFTSTVLVATAPGRLMMFDPTDGSLRASGETTIEPAFVFATTDGSVVVTVEGESGSRRLRSWTLAGDALVPSPNSVALPDVELLTGVLSPSGRRFFLLGDGVDHAVLDVENGDVLARPSGALVQFDFSGRYVATGGNRLTVWDVEAAEPVFSVPEPVKAMTWNSGCDATPSATCRLVTIGNGLDVWEPARGIRTVLADEINAEAVAISADGSTIASGGWGRTVARWSTRLLADDRQPDVLAQAGPGEKVAFDPVSSTEVRRSGVDDVAVLAGGERALVRSSGTWSLFDVDSGAEVALDGRCRADLWAADGSGSFVAALDTTAGLLAVCRASDGGLVANASIGGGVAEPSAIAVDESGSVIVGGGRSFAVYTLVGDRLTTGAAVLTEFGGEASPVSSAAFSNGVVAVGLLGGEGQGTPGPTRGRVVVWDLLAGTEPIAYDVDERDVVGVALLDEARTLATVARDDEGDPPRLQVWETANRRRLGRSLVGLRGDVRSLGGDAVSVVAADSTGQVLRWALSPDPRDDICSILGAPFSDRRLEQLGLDAATDPCR